MDDLIILKAAHFAAQKHSKQRRKGERKDPYINHPIEVAMVIAETGGITDPEILAAAILHDTIEDTNTTKEDIKTLFGGRVFGIVLEVTDEKSLPKDVRKKLQIEHAPALSPEATMIKLADKISNVRDITHSPPKGWNKKRRMEYLDWAAAVAGACNSVNPGLEDFFKRVLEEARAALGVKG